MALLAGASLLLATNDAHPMTILIGRWVSWGRIMAALTRVNTFLNYRVEKPGLVVVLTLATLLIC